MIQFDEPEDWDQADEGAETPGGEGGADDEALDVDDDDDRNDDETDATDDASDDVSDDASDDEPAGAPKRAPAAGDAETDDEEEEGEDEGVDAFDDSEPDDIEDDFANFIDEEMGYADIDWDTIPQKQVDEHDRIRALSANDLAELDLKRANDLFRWAAARASLDHGEEAAFEALAEKLLESKKRSKALDYVDIALAIMARQARRSDYQAAFATLEKLAAVSEGDIGLVERFRGILTIQKGEHESGLEKLASLAETRPDDADFLLSLGEDLCGIGMWEPALEYLEIAEELARAKADNDLLSSIENAAQFAQRHIAYDDVTEEG